MGPIATDKNKTHEKVPRAVLFCQGFRKELAPLLQTRPSPLLNVADKPVIFHIIENLAQKGIGIFDLVLHHFPEQIEEKLEDGSRWGVKIRYHLSKDPLRPLSAILPSIKTWKTTDVLFGMGDCLPLLPETTKSIGFPQFYNAPSKEWTGWALFTSDELKEIPQETLYTSLPSYFKRCAVIDVDPYIAANDFILLKESNKKFLQKVNASFLYPTSLKNIEPGVWISRAVVIEPGAEIAPPVMIGENTQIKSGARIGPNAIIENHCIIDSGSVIEDAIVCQKTYVGEGLEIENCIVDRNSLINLSHGTHLAIEEEFLMSEVSPPSLGKAAEKIFDKCAAAALLALASPLYLLLRALYPIKREKKAAIPAKSKEGPLETFDQYTFDFPSYLEKNRWLSWAIGLPSLWNIIRGEISFVGTKIRTADELLKLPLEWRRLCLATKAGLITLTEVEGQERATDDDLYAQDAIYAASSSLGFDLKVAFRWFLKKITG